ncbi:MAG: hypothetical protein KJ646_00875 [Nanoarchaeota archaeon]|nr:hypothetical protein [Nanoarchaeota archaeon]MBU4116470.1 hypothetical protein [Nanoarchaeota archaeon]
METSIAGEKLDFFIELRNNKLIMGSAIEKQIRNVTEKIISYINQANSLNSFILKTTNKISDEDLSDFIYAGMEKDFRYMTKQKYAPFNIDFKDIAEISCCVGKWQDKRSWIQKKLKPKTSLDEKIKKYSDYYEQSQTQDFFDIRYVDKEPIYYFSNLCKLFLSIDQVLEYQKKFTDKCKNYLKKEVELLRLSDAGELIITKRTNDWTKDMKRGFKEHDWSWLSANWYKEEDELSDREIIKLGGFFKQQAKINEFRFKTLYFKWEKLKGTYNIKESVEQLYQDVLANYNHFGFANIDMMFEE